jgi:hypothetical protein
MVRTSRFAIVPWDNNRIEAVDINLKQSLAGLMDAAKTPAGQASETISGRVRACILPTSVDDAPVRRIRIPLASF